MAIALVLSTCPAANADALGRQPVEERLAACCNRVPGVMSTYWWEGQCQTDAEVLLIFKTTPEGVEPLMKRLAELHPYETPELVVLPVEKAADAYAAWVNREVR